MPKKLLSFFIFLFFFTIVKAEIVNEVQIQGNKRVSDETVKLYGGIDLNKDYSNKDLNRILKNLYDTNFFEDVTIDLERNVLKINLKEYPIINKLIITGEKSNNYKDQIKKIINLKEKGSLIKSNLSKDIEIIKKLYSSRGFNSSKVEAKLNKIDQTKFDLLIEITKGKKSKISSVNFIGNNKVRSNRLREIVASEEDKFWKVLTNNTNFNENLVKLDIRLLRNYYKSLGFYDIKITSNVANIGNEGNVTLTYSIDEGQRYIISKISTNVDPVFDKNLFFTLNDSYKEFIGDYYSPFKVKKLLDNLDDLIENKNLQFVEHNVEEILEQGKIHIKFNIFEGQKVLVERINIIGNNITNEDVIRGELILDEGDPFTNLNLEKSISQIKARGLFRDVQYKVLDGSKNNLKIIEIEVQEQPTGEISAGAGFGTNGGTFAIGISESNWLGQGKKLGFDLEVDEESLSGQLSYTDPNYDFLGNAISYYISSEDNDKPNQGYENTLISSGINTSFEQYKDVGLTLGLDLSYDDLRTDSIASDSLKKQSGSFTELSGLYGFTVDKRNRSFNPTDGSILKFSQSAPFYADKSFLSNQFSVSGYKTLSEDIIGASKFFLSTINGLGSDDVRLSKRKSLGSKRIRGFERNKIGPVDGSDHIGGNYAASLNLETNLPNLLPEDTKTDVGLFLDFANVWGVDYDDSLDDSNKIRSSTGVTMNWMSPLGPMNFVLSQNLSKADTDSTESFSFNLGTTF